MVEGEIEVKEEGGRVEGASEEKVGEKRWLAKFLVSAPDVISKQT